MSIRTTGYSHVRLTVTDIQRSRAFYDSIFGLPVAYELSDDADEETKAALSFLYGGVIYSFGDSLFGLRPVAPGEDRFDENRVGLDHLSFAVADPSELHLAIDLLEAQNVPHSGIKDIGAGLILEFRDPDGIALELTSPPEQG
jgi:catechol 2,3-dioxygenase-like lactoylglutathione lyase family enzyme